MTTTLILSSGKCAWGKCYACGWGSLEAKVDVEGMKAKVNAMSFDPSLKVFCSGSFLDDRQFPREFRQWFADAAKKKGVRNLTVESLPSFITGDTIADFAGLDLTVAIGLESGLDSVLEKYGKPFRTADFAKAADLLHAHKCKVRTYLMVNIPFAGDIEKELKESVEFALPYSDSLVLINTFPHSKAKLFDDWISGKWRPLSVKDFEKIVAPYKSNPKIETDSQNYAFKPKFEPEKKELIEGASLRNLNHPHFNVWQDYFQRFYEPPKGKDILLFLPCSFKKPYATSATHKAIYKALSGLPQFNRIHRVVVSNPGVIPMEFSDYYPFDSYDWPEWDETPELMAKYVEVTKERVKAYLEAHKGHYAKVYCFLKYSETYEAVKAACKELDIPAKNLLDLGTWDNVKGEKNAVINPLSLAALKRNFSRE